MLFITTGGLSAGIGRGRIYPDVLGDRIDFFVAGRTAAPFNWRSFGCWPAGTWAVLSGHKCCECIRELAQRYGICFAEMADGGVVTGGQSTLCLDPLQADVYEGPGRPVNH